MPRKYKILIQGLIFLILGVCIYAPAMDNEFLMDDLTQIVDNPQVHDLSQWTKLFSGSTIHEANGEQGLGIYYKPIMIFFYAVVWHINKAPAAFHAFQLLVHLLSALIVWRLFCFFISIDIAWVAALIYLVHPYQAETVIYAADLQDVLYQFFGLAGLLVLAGIKEAKNKIFFRWIAFTALLLLSLLSKESGLLYVFITGLYLLFYQRKSLIPWLVSCAANLGIYFYLRLSMAGLQIGSEGMTRIGRAELPERLLTAPLVIWKYIQWYFVPSEFTTNQDWLVRSLSFKWFVFPLLGVAAVTALFVFYALRKGGSAAWFFLIWCIAGLGFHSHIVVALDGTLSPRWFYFPFIGLTALVFLVFESYLANFLKQKVYAQIAIALVSILIIGLSILASIRAQEWHDNTSLFTAEIQKLPDSYVVQSNYGTQLFLSGNIAEAKKHFEESIRLTPEYTVNWNNLGAVHEYYGDLKEAEKCYLQSMKNGPYYKAYDNYARILAAEKRDAELQTFLREKALPLFPKDPKLQALVR